MGFWKGAVGTKKQKICWIVFSIIVGIIALFLMFLLMPIRFRNIMVLNGGEWAHFYPDSFWHGSATYSFETHPSSGTGKVLDSAVAYVYNIKKNGVFLDYDNEAEGINNVVISNNSTLSGVVRNWNASALVTDGSQIKVILDLPLSVPIDFIMCQTESCFLNWTEGKNDLINKNEILESKESVKELSVTVDIASSFWFRATRRIYVGIKVTSGSNSIAVLRGNYYHSIARVRMDNSTSFTSGQVAFEFNDRQLLQVNAPDECTSAESDNCTMSVRLEPRWLLYLGVVVIPIIILSVGLVVGLMAIKALHVRQMIADMRKKATEEGIALEEGKSKDIHQERLDEAEAEADMSEPRNSSDEPSNEDSDKSENDKPAGDDNQSGAAVLTTSTEEEK